jgi:hypothetical protein
MHHPIAQLVALTCHGNAFLAGRDIPAFFPSNSTCQFCDRIEFVEPDVAPGTEHERTMVADNPDDWIHALPLREVDGLRLVFGPRNDPNISDRMAAGFIRGGHVWSLQVVRDDGQTERWSSNWGVWNQQAPDRRIWRVTYRLEATRASRPYVGRNLAIVKASFRDSLTEILEFSERYTQGAFTSHFAEALEALADPQADVGYYKDLAMPEQLGDDAASLLKASMRAWVFGGMGSWNDMSFEQPIQTEYENVSDRLYDVVHEAIEASATSTYLTS